MNVFLAHPFTEEDRPLVAQIERLLASQDVAAVTGENLGGGSITDKVMARIERCDGLVALLTRDKRVGSTKRWRARPWVEEELSHARAQHKPAIALVEGAVDTTGAYTDHERIDLDRAAPTDALLKLSEAVRVWKNELGWGRQIQLKPDELAHMLRTQSELKCRYRFVSRIGEKTDWRDTPDPITQPGGAVIYVNGVHGDDQFIELEIVKGDTMEWYSPATAQMISVELRPRNGGGA